jgi:hypothetical protein
MRGEMGPEPVLAGTENGIVTDIEEAVPDVAPVGVAGDSIDTLQVHPVLVKKRVRLPVPPEGNTRNPFALQSKSPLPDTLLYEHAAAVPENASHKMRIPSHIVAEPTHFLVSPIGNTEKLLLLPVV